MWQWLKEFGIIKTVLSSNVIWKFDEIDKKGILKAPEHDKYENIAGSAWLSLFMGSNGNAYYYPRRLGPRWAQLNIYTKKQYNFDPSLTM
jgi:hypothetical protein